VKITPFFRWYDLWVGAYVNTKGKAVYVCPLPMVGIKIQYGDPRCQCEECRSIRSRLRSWGMTPVGEA
jgi:hypothetical protein